ncbi:MAG TPA: DegT/DnrJ/EryC1/StrS family aminotransferase [Gaiellaceae bacterium]|nr:DegT/DnrJ/EryC1/StrS family aminotransferase [Gaiellaceae bacterium]
MLEQRPQQRLSVPFLDLGPVHAGLKRDLLEDLAALIDSGTFTNGPHVEAFERAFAAYCGRARCVGVANGTDALRLALLAAAIDPGDEALVPANTFAATFEAVAQAGGVPVPVDVAETDYNLDPAAAAAAVGPRTRFLVPVHLYGQLADMAALERVAGAAGLALLEDACQAHGARRDGRVAGGAGFAAAFSFYPGKNLGAFGDAGAVVLDDPALAAALRALREHGQREKYRHLREGWTSRLDTLQALVLLRKLPLLDGWNAERRAAAAAYGELLDGVGDLRLPPVAPGSEPVWHLYPVGSGHRDPLAAFLRRRGIGVGLHYPEPPHLSAAYRHLGHRRGAFPVSERLADELLSLPLFPGIAEAQLEAVADAVAAFFRRG